MKQVCQFLLGLIVVALWPALLAVAVVGLIVEMIYLAGGEALGFAKAQKRGKR